VHEEGNPHFHVDPHRIVYVLDAWSARLQQLFPSQTTEIARRHAEFKKQWSERINEWERRAAPAKGRSVAAQHSTFAYLWQWLGMAQVADLEPKPGMPPTPGHLQSLLNRLRAQPPAAIVLNSYQDPRAGRWLSEQLGTVRLVQLPATVEDVEAADALGRWMDQLVGEVLKP
jgi:zinc/manganese transport system substrate-binding protein